MLFLKVKTCEAGDALMQAEGGTKRSSEEGQLYKNDVSRSQCHVSRNQRTVLVRLGSDFLADAICCCCPGVGLLSSLLCLRRNRCRADTTSNWVFESRRAAASRNLPKVTG